MWYGQPFLSRVKSSNTTFYVLLYFYIYYLGNSNESIGLIDDVMLLSQGFQSNLRKSLSI